MRTDKVEFPGAAGQTLCGRYDRPDGTPRAVALFAHCFTCDKTSKAAVHIGRELTGRGVAVLRFDFTGLGESEGELEGFSGEVADLVAAAKWLAGRGEAPALLIGHSLGGAAVLAAASEIASAKAVAVIGAPADPAHVLKTLGDGLAKIEADGQAQVNIGGRPFTVTRRFVDDVRMQDLKARVAGLGRALLLLHSPVDEVVGVENAQANFIAARHPKSFVSLDTADHLLTRGSDADYAADVIATWAARYVALPAAVAAADDGAVHVEETGAGKFQVEVSARGWRLMADEPLDVGGLGSGPGPYELIAAGLGACTAMTVRLYAERKGWPLARIRVAVRHDKVSGQTPPDVFDRRIALEGPLDAEQTARLMDIAEKCPVHRTLEAGAQVVTGQLDTPPMLAADADEHFHAMEHECDKADCEGEAA
jgi:putative redox protein